MNDLWLSLRFPRLSLDLLQKKHGPSQPRAVVENQRILQRSELAQAGGVDPGMSVSTALALCKELITHPRDTEEESRTQRALAQWCYQYTPCVSMRRPELPGNPHRHDNTILMELRGSLRLFGGLAPLLESLCQGLQKQGYSHIASLGHTPEAAWLLGFDTGLNLLDSCGSLKNPDHQSTLNHELFSAQLQQLDILHLPLTKKEKQRLANLGLSQLGELLRLPSASLARRFGESLSRQLDRLCGRSPDLQHFIQPQHNFFAECHSLDGLTSVDMLEPAISELLHQLHQFLTRLQLHCQELQWRFFHFDRQSSNLSVELSSAQNQVQNFMQLTRLKLHNFQIQSPIETVQLSSQALFTSEVRSLPLFRELGSQSLTDSMQLLDTLRARLGNKSIVRLSGLDEHLPELRQHTCAPDKKVDNKNLNTDSVSGNNQLPLWLLPEPRPLRQSTQREIVSGAQRLDSHWWQQQQQRAYVIARDNTGYQWIFYDPQKKRWFLHGLFG